MSKCRRLVSHLVVPKRQQRRWISNSAAHVNSNHHASDSTVVSPAQLLRYALTGDPNNATTKGTELKVDEELDLFLSKHNFDRRQWGRLIPLPGAEPPTTDFPASLGNICNIHELQLWFEQYAALWFKPVLPEDMLKEALLRCEKSHSSLEILSVLNAIISRHDPQRNKPSKALHIAGLYYASQAFSSSAFRYHLKALKMLRQEDAKQIIQCLLRTLQTIRLANPAYDMRSMLELVAGEHSNIKNPGQSLMDIVQLDDGLHSSMAELLCELGASKSHKTLWDSLMGRAVDNPSPTLVDDAYKCILVFLKAGMNEYATSSMEKLISQVSHIPPSLSVASELAAFLNERGVEVPSIIEMPIQEALSQALDQGTTSIDDMQLDDGTVNFSIIQSLLSRIAQYGTSLSASNIALVIDALNECEGLTIPLFTQTTQDQPLEFAWSIQWAPVVSASDPISFSTTPYSQTLGLLRARIVTREILINPERCRNLIQLGHLVQREFVSSQSDSFQDGKFNTWNKTGYLVAFDRVSAEYLIIYMGENFNIVDPEGSSLNGFNRHPLLGSLSNLVMPSNAQDLERDIADVVLPVRNAANVYYLDLDPGDSLRP